MTVKKKQVYETSWKKEKENIEWVYFAFFCSLDTTSLWLLCKSVNGTELGRESEREKSEKYTTLNKWGMSREYNLYFSCLLIYKRAFFFMSAVFEIRMSLFRCCHYRVFPLFVHRLIVSLHTQAQTHRHILCLSFTFENTSIWQNPCERAGVWVCACLCVLDTMIIALMLCSFSISITQVETVGDKYMAVSGLPEACENHAKWIAKLALDMLDMAKYVQMGAEPVVSQTQTQITNNYIYIHTLWNLHFTRCVVVSFAHFSDPPLFSLHFSASSFFFLSLWFWLYSYGKRVFYLVWMLAYALTARIHIAFDKYWSQGRCFNNSNKNENHSNSVCVSVCEVENERERNRETGRKWKKNRKHTAWRKQT